MKKFIIIIVSLSLAVTSCSLFKKKIKVDEAIAQKIEIEKTENPAKKRLILNDLKNKRIIIDDVVVKKITESTNIDYDFCVIVDGTFEGKDIECYIYTKNVYKISKLIEGESRISVIGDFSRFFTMLDEYYSKLEIIDAKINLINQKKQNTGSVEKKEGTEKNTKNKE